MIKVSESSDISTSAFAEIQLSICVFLFMLEKFQTFSLFLAVFHFVRGRHEKTFREESFAN